MHRQHSSDRARSETIPVVTSHVAPDACDSFDDAIGLEAEVACLLDIEGTLGTTLGLAELD